MLKSRNIILISITYLILFAGTGVNSRDIFSPSTGTEVPSNVENMYRKGLQYLVTTQTKDGSWKDNYGRQPGVVGLCVVAMLAHGDDPNFGPYSANIKKGINFLLSSANSSNGYMGSSMYNHGFATLALAEAYGVVRDERIGPALQKAVNLLLTSQSKNSYKAWRYSPTSRDADTTVSGACLVALLAAANAGLHVPEKAIKEALAYYETCQGNAGGFGYTSRGGPNLARTAIGALCYSLAGKKKSNVYKKAKSYLINNAQSRRTSSYYFYYLYYGSQAFFHMPEAESWAKWNEINIKTLETLQGPDGGWTGSHGRSFSTASALLSLALNYRFLPIYERQ